MSNWTDKYIKIISSSYKQHVLLEDKDNLLQYEELKERITDAGYAILVAKSHLEARLLFEQKVRGNKEKTIIVVPTGFKPLPDMIKATHFQTIGISQLFPNLDSSAIGGLGFNALCTISNIRPYEELGQESTLKFLLENLYNIDFDTLTQHKTSERALCTLITVFFEKYDINQALLKFLTRITNNYLPNLTKKGLNRKSLTDYLQHQWDAYVANDPVDFDFEDASLAKNIGYLFVFEVLKPVKVTNERRETLPKALRVGTYLDQQQDNENELEGTVLYLEEQSNIIEDLFSQWFNIVQVLASVKLRSFKSKDTALISRFAAVERSLNQRFQRFLENNYTSLFSLSGIRRPVIVTRILEHIKAQPSKRKALLVIDGMNYWQWQLLSQVLVAEGLNIEQGTTLAYIPTITAWSRQAIFKGNKPDLNADNSGEAIIFEEYWKQYEYQGYEVKYMKLGVNKNFDTCEIDENVTMLGLVCNDLDDIMHGSMLGNQQLKTSTEQWISQSKIVEKIASLLKKGFTLFITSDHGNVEARGIKNLQLKDRVGSLSRSKRHIHFSNETILEEFKEQNIGMNYGERNNSIFLKDDSAFAVENAVVITHGGSHLWEVLIPFITIK